MYPTISPAAAMTAAFLRRDESIAQAEARRSAELVAHYRHEKQGRLARGSRQPRSSTPSRRVRPTVLDPRPFLLGRLIAPRR